MAEDLQLIRAGAQAAIQGPAEWFSGTVRIDKLFNAPQPSRVGMGVVNFEPGARTNWHTHPVGQIIVITDGVGWVQTEGAPRIEVGTGDIVYFNPNVRHWHGATDKTYMQHIAIQETVDGSAVDWLEPVSDADYLSGVIHKINY